jgi:membrane protein
MRNRIKKKNRAQGIISILIGTWRQMRAADVQILAGSLAFSTTMSIVPLLAVSLSVFKAYGGFNVLMKQIEPLILQNLVEASGVHVSKFITSSVERIQSGKLGLGGATALFVTSTKLLFDMETAVRRVWSEKWQRPRVRRLIVYWAVMFIAPLMMAIALGVIGSKDLGLIRVLPKHLIAFGFTFLGFFSINKFVPTAFVRVRSALLSATVGALSVAIAQKFYASITKQVLSYSKIYGSLASIPIFLLWILILWWIVLGSVALCATLENAQPQAQDV